MPGAGCVPVRAGKASACLGLGLRAGQEPDGTPLPLIPLALAVELQDGGLAVCAEGPRIDGRVED